MQIDTILEALSNMRQRLMTIGGAHSADQVYTRLAMIDVLRQCTLADDGADFTDYCQRHLAMCDGDTMVDILEELYEELGMDAETTMWDEFANKFLTETV